MQENGPYLLRGTNATLQNNSQYSWNRIANMLYLESPPGVGFSINNITGYEYSDENTAQANFWALNRFLDRFGMYSKHRFWITGESYAGMYIPFLADKIRVNNLDPLLDTYKIPLEGFLIGNGAFILDWNMIGVKNFLLYKKLVNIRIINILPKIIELPGQHLRLAPIP
jgi:carboxypeptidase C (cathepsin A)